MHSKKQAGISWVEAVILAVSSFMLLGISVFALQHNTTALTNTFSSEILWSVFTSSLLTITLARNAITVTLATAQSWRKSIIVPLLSVICILMAAGTLLEFGDGDVQLFGSRTLCVWGWEISKNKLIDIAGVFVFPYAVMLLARTKEFRHFIPGIICMTLLNTLFFWQQTALIFLWLSLLQISAVSGALFFTIKLQRRYAVGWSLLYTLLCAFILRLHQGGETLIEWLLPYDWRERKQFVSELIQSAHLFGRATATEHTLYLLEDVSRPIQSLLFYGGWLPAIGYLVLLTVFAGYVVRCLTALEVQKRYDFCILLAAAVNLLLRTVLGLLSEFGFISVRVGLPFATTVGYSMDTMSLLLLLSGAIQKDYFETTDVQDEEDMQEEEDIPNEEDTQEEIDHFSEEFALALESDLQDAPHDFLLEIAENKLFYILLLICTIFVILGTYNSALAWLQETVSPLRSSWVDVNIQYL